MRALTVIPLQAGSAAVVDMPEPEPGPGELLVDGIALGVCGTDREIMDGDYGWAPPGAERLVLGHESLGRVREAPDGSDFAPGDLVVGVVRRPDPEPCPACARGEFDFCRNGRYTERGIKELHGYGSERWTVEADYAVKLDPSLRAGRDADGADHDPGQGVGPDRADRRPRLLRARARAGDRRRPDRAAGGDARRPARARGARARPRHRRHEAAARRRPRRPLPQHRASPPWRSTSSRTSSSRRPEWSR